MKNDLNNGEREKEYPIVSKECICKDPRCPHKTKPPFKDALRGFTHCNLCGKEAEPSMLTVEEIVKVIFGMDDWWEHTPRQIAKAIHEVMVRKGEGRDR